MTASPLPHPAKTGSENCLEIGTRVAEFEITSVVGEGGFGTVYLAFDHSLQRTIALKEYLPPALAGRGSEQQVAVRAKRHQETFDAGLKSFINEARLLAQFDHPALIKVYRFWEQNSTAYMAMRYYEGKTLKEILTEQPELATEAWWKTILKPILEALDVLYNVQILHRDISPENIMIQPGGEPVLLDFGAARQLVQNMTQALTVILKPGFAPIEQYADDPSMKQGPWTDIYALSAVLYSSIAKKAPPASVARMIKDPLEPLTPDDYPGYSRQFLFAISKGLAVRPDDRPQTIAEFSHLLGLDKPAAGTSGASRRSSDRKQSSKESPRQAPAPAPAATTAEKNAPQSAAARTAASISGKTSPGRQWLIGSAVVIGLVALGLFFFRATNEAAPAQPAAPSVAGAAVRVAPATSATSPIQAAKPALADNDSAPKAPANRLATSQPAAKPARATVSPPRDAAASLPAARTGTVQLMIKPWGTILVDGASRGVSPPLKKMMLPEGKHQIRVINPNFRDHVIEIMVTDQTAVRVEHDFARSKK